MIFPKHLPPKERCIVTTDVGNHDNDNNAIDENIKVCPKEIVTTPKQMHNNKNEDLPTVTNTTGD